MADDRKRPFSSPFDSLKDLKGRLPKTRAEREAERRREREAEEARRAAEAGEVGGEPETDEDFDRRMQGWGVERIEPGRERVLRRPAPASGSAAPAGAPRRGRVRRGQRGPEDGFDESTPRLDLHGLTVEHALAELHRHLQAWRAAGVLRARIVTGRGAHSGDGRAAIREAVEERLVAAAGVAGVYRGNPAAGGDGVVLLELSGPGKRSRRRS